MQDEIENITVAEFLQLPEDDLVQQFFLLRNIRPKAKYLDKEVPAVKNLAFKDVVMLKRLRQKDQITSMVQGVFDITDEDIVKMEILTFFPLLNHILMGLDEIQKMEEMNLMSETEGELLAAGVDRMERYGELALIDQLAGGDFLKWGEVECEPYIKVFTKLCMEKDRSDIQKNYADIMRSKQQHAHS